MKSIIAFTLSGVLILSAVSCKEKNNVVPAPSENTEKSISLKIENGTSLTYKVSPTEMVNYSLDITFRELRPKLAYEFVMTNMDYTKGTVEQDENALKNAFAYTSQFNDGKSAFTDKTSMILSLQAYRDIVETGKVNLSWDGEEKEFNVISNDDFQFEKGNGKVMETTIHCVSSDKSIEFWVWKNPELPLLMRIKEDPASIELTYWYLPGERP